MHTIFSVSAVVKISGTRSLPEIFKSNPGSAKPVMTQAYLIERWKGKKLTVPTVFWGEGREQQ